MIVIYKENDSFNENLFEHYYYEISYFYIYLPNLSEFRILLLSQADRILLNFQRHSINFGYFITRYFNYKTLKLLTNSHYFCLIFYHSEKQINYIKFMEIIYYLKKWIPFKIIAGFYCLIVIHFNI